MIMPEPLSTISIVTPSYQHAPFLEAAIDSVLHQDYPNLEYLVADGGSTDGTIEILKKYQSRLKWFSEPDRGQTDAINKGFARTSGEILGWLNSDDEYAPGALRTVGDFFAANPDVGLVYGDANFIDARGGRLAACAHIEPFNRRRLLYYCDYIVQPAAFFRRSVFQSVGGMDESLHWAMDYDFWLKASAVSRCQYIPRVLAHYRWLATSKTGIGGPQRLVEVEQVARRHGASGLPAYFRLEAVRMHVADALNQASHGRLHRATGAALSAVGALLTSPRAMASLCHEKTWRTIWTGQLLRNSTRSR
jgi:glycosyltransferase involved in cell wall biosynthesis